MRNGLVLLAVGCAGVVSASTACTRLSTGARDSFGVEHSCPEDQITVRSRSDVDYGERVLARLAPETPSREVSGDPARLAKWRDDQAARRARTGAEFSAYSVFQVTGCGHEELLACAHPSDSEGTYLGVVTCAKVPQPVAAHSR
jgi:hypothetical protein